MPGGNAGRGGDGESGREQGCHGAEEASSVHTGSLVLREKENTLSERYIMPEIIVKECAPFPGERGPGSAGPVGTALLRACF